MLREGGHGDGGEQGKLYSIITGRVSIVVCNYEFNCSTLKPYILPLQSQCSQNVVRGGIPKPLVLIKVGNKFNTQLSSVTHLIITELTLGNKHVDVRNFSVGIA